jgi:NitT/TauT family transport system permease protein
VIILGKFDKVLEAIRQNFAISWMMIAMVENLCKSDGGIGVIIADQNKYFKFDYVWAIQLLILLTGIGMDYALRRMKEYLLPYAVLTTKRK